VKKPDISRLAAQLVTPGSRELAYEMAVCVCDADAERDDAEQQFPAISCERPLNLPENSEQPSNIEFA